MNLSRSLLLVVLSLTLLAAFSGYLSATPYVPPDQIKTHYGVPCYEVPIVDATYNHFFEFTQISAWEQPLQCEDPGVNFGGQREEEPGGGWYIIETDNTLEAIWVWSRYYELTGDPQFNDEIADAWTYAYNFPAWLEGFGYYSAHNCAWALAAENKYRTVFNDSSHWDYAVQSANYINNYPLVLSNGLNVMVTGWCCGNLYLYGEATGNDLYMTTAASRGEEVIAWIEFSPQTRLAMESWAMSSGTFVWGLCKSTFRADSVYGQTWLATYGPMVQVFEPNQQSWSNAWNVAYCNAQGGMYDVTGEQTYSDNHLWLTNYLLHKDLDNDGGIPASALGSSNADASWTSAYLAMMGCNYYLKSGDDAGVLIIRSPANRTRISLAIPVDVIATVGNWGTNLLEDVMVVTSGAYVDTMIVDLNPQANLNLNFGQWIPIAPGIDSLRVTVYADGDTVSFNDSDVNLFMVQSSAGPLDENAEDSQLALNASVNNGSLKITYELPYAGNVSLVLYNVRGREVVKLSDGWSSIGNHIALFNIADLPSGVYFARMQTDDLKQTQKILLIK
ncbi:hypothetical protein CEE37_04060 [candidate division LCP-89 bacterium B3_LCP]|uniref:Secretion system C-terminal sorting domain-containing protein n=1 Tax=candidate division LCP-89 bacterium B3_LCP TaxID=2012998 RepID=A0A532V3F7_UNCL8|nr:MAG: hypothetical protein CEE37_04060 [candidate division LCP-89 bacterium B3_LCP]